MCLNCHVSITRAEGYRTRGEESKQRGETHIGIFSINALGVQLEDIGRLFFFEQQRIRIDGATVDLEAGFVCDTIAVSESRGIDIGSRHIGGREAINKVG